MFKPIALTLFVFTLLIGTPGFQSECSAQYDLQAQDYELTKLGSGQYRLEGYIRNVSNAFYEGNQEASAIAYMTIYYPQYQRYQYVAMEPISQAVWPHWNRFNSFYNIYGGGYDFWDYRFVREFKPDYYNTPATVMVMVWDKRYSSAYDVNLSNWIVGGYRNLSW